MEINDYKKYEPFFGSWYFENEKSKLGSGKFGSVFKVIRHDAKVPPSALKIITIPKEDSEIATRRSEGMDDIGIQKFYQHMVDDIKKEYELMSELKGCNNIVSCEDFIAFRHEDGFGFDIVIRMELLKPLIEYENEKAMDQMEIMKFGIDMCLALERCEIKNIIHRDIKPDNIFISSMGDFKLGDFGIARTIEATDLVLSSRTGTPNYMAPEVYFSRVYDKTVDIYSLGIVLYRMLNNRLLPFLKPKYESKDGETAFIKRIKGAVLPRPANGDEALKSIVLKACAYHRQERYQSPEEMRKDLEMVRSILKDGGTVPEEFAIDLDATVAMTDADITEQLEDEIVRRVTGQQNPKVPVPIAYSNESLEKQHKKKLFVKTAIMTMGIGIFFGAVIFLNKTVFLKEQEIDVTPASKEQLSSLNSNIKVNENDKEENKENSENNEESQQNQDENIKEKEQEQNELIVTKLNAKELKTISEITKYKNLEILDLAEMEIEELSFVKDLKRLKQLNISYTNISDIRPLKKCSNLLFLNISYNNENMTEKKIVETLSSMKQLQELDATGDMIVGKYEDMLKSLTKLTVLHLGGTGISNGEFLKKCKELKELDLQSNLMFTDFKKLVGLKHLEKLNLSVTGVEKLDGIEKLTQLKELDISMTDISDISMLETLQGLENVIVSESPEIKKQIKSLQKKLKNCRFQMV